MTMKFVVITPQIPIGYRNGGIATFVKHLVELLRGKAAQIEIVYTELVQGDINEVNRYFHEIGVKFVPLLSKKPEPPNGLRLWQYVSHLVDEYLADRSDISLVLFADWRANGFITAKRKKLFGLSFQIATIMHGSSSWHREGTEHHPTSLEEIEHERAERYVVENSDFILSPSNYAVQWAKSRYWKLSDDRVHVLYYPFVPEAAGFSPADPVPSCSITAAPGAGRKVVRRLVFFSRLDTRKGIDLFVDALRLLSEKDQLGSVTEILLLGNIGPNRIGHSEQLSAYITEHTGLPVVVHDNLDSREAIGLLSSMADDTLVVVPSRAETLGFVVIECTFIEGLNVVFSSNTAMKEIFGMNESIQYFESTVESLAKKLRQFIESGLLSSSELGKFDFQACNCLWEKFLDRNAFGVNTPVAARVAAMSPERFNGAYKADEVDVLIPFFNLGKYLGAQLESLDRQNAKGFNVYVLDDGSTDAHSIAAFDALVEKYRRNERYHFFREANRGVCGARNRLAELSSRPYIMWLDSDNLSRPHMINCLLQAIKHGGFDYVTSYMETFVGDHSPLIGVTRNEIRKPDFTYAPVGPFLVEGMLDNPFGDLNCIMKREAFDRIGGYTDDMPKWINQEDRELMTAIALQGGNVEVVPEVLFYYRTRPDSRLRTSPAYLNESRALRPYREFLSRYGLETLPDLMLGYQYKVRYLESHSAGNSPLGRKLRHLERLRYRRPKAAKLLEGIVRLAMRCAKRL